MSRAAAVNAVARGFLLEAEARVQRRPGALAKLPGADKRTILAAARMPSEMP